ncbi:MAG TPA: cupin domain-containing protein [Candidatus Polarisedimenticolaceae bacterium]|nr:cupin domain-containing protein [Candidatus Polarisedimenticolaceae bacterium]
MTRMQLAVLALPWLFTATASGAADSVTHIGSAAVAAAFAEGRPLIESENYKVHASRRQAPGMAELHTRDTDIIYVVEGSARLITGGSVVDARATAAEELRGSAIAGGVERDLARGDVVIVPSGTPHWFQQVSDPFLYYVVKVRSADGGAR